MQGDGSGAGPQSTGWRAKVRELATARARRETKAHGEGEAFIYRLEHVKETVRLSLWLGKALGADLEVLEAAAWLHDVAKGKAAPGSKGDAHGVVAAEEARDLLRGTDFPAEKVEAVCQAIERHVGLYKDYRVEPLEAAILWDADKLTKLGATALVLHLASLPGEGHSTLAEIAQEGEGWLPVAERIAQSLNTEPAKALARGRLDFLRAFYHQLAEELGEV